MRVFSPSFDRPGRRHGFSSHTYIWCHHKTLFGSNEFHIDNNSNDCEKDENNKPPQCRHAHGLLCHRTEDAPRACNPIVSFLEIRLAVLQDVALPSEINHNVAANVFNVAELPPRILESLGGLSLQLAHCLEILPVGIVRALSGTTETPKTQKDTDDAS